MSQAAALAGVAGALAVAGAWQLVAALDDAAVGRRIVSFARPLMAAGRAGAEPSGDERRRLAITGALVLLAGGWLLAGPTAGVLAATAGPWAGGALLRSRRRRWQAALAAAAPAVARALADALAGGHSVRGALTEAGCGAPAGPAAAELAAASRLLALGERTEAVLERLRRRAGHPSWDALVAAVLLQRDAGGDLADLLRGLATAGEEARRAEADARALTSQARYTARIVATLPLGAAALAELGSPGFLASLARTPLSLLLAVTAALLLAGALLAVDRIARVAT